MPVDMSLIEFKSLCAELKYVPDEAENIVKHWPSANAIAPLLVTALKALSIADDIMMKQADTILQSTHEVTACLKDLRTGNLSGPKVLSETNIFDASDYESMGDITVNEAGSILPSAESTKINNRICHTQPQHQEEPSTAMES